MTAYQPGKGPRLSSGDPSPTNRLFRPSRRALAPTSRRPPPIIRTSQALRSALARLTASVQRRLVVHPRKRWLRKCCPRAPRPPSPTPAAYDGPLRAISPPFRNPDTHSCEDRIPALSGRAFREPSGWHSAGGLRGVAVAIPVLEVVPSHPTQANGSCHDSSGARVMTNRVLVASDSGGEQDNNIPKDDLLSGFSKFRILFVVVVTITVLGKFDKSRNGIICVPRHINHPSSLPFQLHAVWFKPSFL